MSIHNFTFFFTLLFTLFYFLQSEKSIIRTIAGIPKFGGDGGLALNANLYQPYGLALSSKNELYIADTGNHCIRKVDKYGIITTVIGIPGEAAYAGDGGLAVNANLNRPYALAFSESNEMYIADGDNKVIRKVFVNGTISTFAGNSYASTQSASGDGGNALDAKFNRITCVVITKENEVYICDFGSHAIRKVFVNGTITTVAGIVGTSGYSGDGGLATQATLYNPFDIFVTEDKELYISDSKNQIVRKVVVNGTMTTIAGTPKICTGMSGDFQLATQAQVCYPTKLYLDELKQLFIVESGGCAIRKVFANQTIVTVAGVGSLQCSYTGDYGLATQATFASPYGFVIHSNNDWYISDSSISVVRKVSHSDGIIRPFAGNSPFSDKAEVQYQLKRLNNPTSIHVTSNSDIYIADTYNYVIKKYSASNSSMEIIAGILSVKGYNGEKMATNSTLGAIQSIVVKEDTNQLYLTDLQHTLRRVDLHTGVIELIAGIPGNSGYNGLTIPSETKLSNPSGIYVNKYNEIYLVDSGNALIRKLSNDTKTIETIAGIYNRHEFSGDFKNATDATLNHPSAIFIDESTDIIYISDFANNRIRKIVNGIISTVAVVNGCQDIRVNSKQELLVSSTADCSIRKIYPNGTIEMIVSKGTSQLCGFSGDEKDPLQARLYAPNGLFVTENDVLYIADSGNGVIRKVHSICEEYSFDNSFALVNNQNQLLVTMNSVRTCTQEQSTNEWFGYNYYPLIEMKYTSTNETITKLVGNWNQPSMLVTNLEDQLLDSITVQVNACSDAYLISDNCTSAIQSFGIIPSSANHNFLLFSSLKEISLINYYKLSDNVKSFQMSVKLINTNTNQIEIQTNITTPSKTTIISNLQHSTIYQVNISTTVVYTNGIQLESVGNSQLISTTMGILPMGNVVEFAAEEQTDSILLSWKSIPFYETTIGNGDSYRLEINYWNQEVWSNENTQVNIVTISNYDPSINLPATTTLDTTLLTRNQNYFFQIQFCTSIGCSNASEVVESMIASSISTDPIYSSVSIVISIAIIIVFFVIIACIVLVLLIIFMIILILVKQRRRTMQKNILHTNEELLDQQSISKEFRIEESNLNFTNSQVLGSGASGSVFTAFYFHYKVAVKLIKKSSMGMETDLTDFYNELQFLQSNTQHNNIIRFFGVYESVAKNSLGLVMEYCSNGTVAHYVTKNRISFSQKLQIILGIANGMQYLHHFKIAHRDLKCENVLLDENMVPKIIDFGFSRVIEEEANKSLNLTMNIGTAAYCAPEIIQYQVQSPLIENTTSSQQGIDLSQQSTGHTDSSISSAKRLAYDMKCDVYSFAIVIFVIYFQNKLPYGQVQDNQIFFQLAKNPEFRPVFEASTVPTEEMWLIELMKQCWSTDSDQRPSFEQISSILDQHCKM